MIKLLVFGLLMNWLMFFTICPGNVGINLVFTLGLLGVLFDSLREKIMNKEKV